MNASQPARIVRTRYLAAAAPVAPPADLNEAGMALWQRCLAQKSGLSEGELLMLEDAARSRDLAEAARTQIKAEGLTVPTSGGWKANPLCQVELGARARCRRG